ncbi:hypothetical protein J7E99_38425 [Streptomyces sp. ISL-44]|uniref:hypothetical protein n=1 Tax=Streptomyces sp. ISL-44 TaxID=2819184 RepID=UPI001BE57A5F|nr:hypothetical protein [Streptomyces sp. ISL-44]MBT2546385.1 hypothetical protein [Streptomyces sp. ISL-44]
MFGGTIVLSIVLVVIGLFQHTGPIAEADLTTAGRWLGGTGLFLFVTAPIPLAVRHARNNPAMPGEPYEYPW